MTPSLFSIALLTALSDVTDEAALNATHQKIVNTLPPIAGALNGAMVLKDVSVRNMELDHMMDVMRPKVLGSIHLDRIFHNINLDFFVLMSSINCVIGTSGQANYAAANMGLCGVAAHRRKRGLNSSYINLGMMFGVGYVTESSRQLDQVFAKLAMMPLSEDDFHQIFAEGVEAGYLDSPNGPEMSTGLLNVTPDSANIPGWCSDPKFAHLIVHHTVNSDDKADQGNVAPLQDQLWDCQTEQDILRVISRE